MEEQKNMIGHCKHGEFDLTKGCPECMAEVQRGREEPVIDEVPGPYIVKVRYYSRTANTGQTSDREYSYFSVDQLEVGQFVQVPVSDRAQLAIVTQVDVPYREIESFIDRMKTIPSGSRRPAPEPETPPQSVPTAYPDDYEESNKDPLFGDCRPAEEPPERDPLSRPDSSLLRGETFNEPVPYGVQILDAEVREPGTAIVAIAPESDEAIIKLYAEGEKAQEYAKARFIETNDDLKSATNDLVAIKNLRESMEAKRLDYVRPIRAHLDEVNAIFKRLQFPFEEADRITRGKVNEFRAIEQAKIDLQRREAEAKGGVTTVERQEPVPAVTRTDLGTAGSRTVWHCEIIDFAQVPDDYKLPNESKILAHARTTKGKVPIPGVKIWSDKEVTVRRRKGES